MNLQLVLRLEGTDIEIPLSEITTDDMVNPLGEINDWVRSGCVSPRQIEHLEFWQKIVDATPRSQT